MLGWGRLVLCSAGIAVLDLMIDRLVNQSPRCVGFAALCEQDWLQRQRRLPQCAVHSRRALIVVESCRKNRASGLRKPEVGSTLESMVCRRIVANTPPAHCGLRRSGDGCLQASRHACPAADQHDGAWRLQCLLVGHLLLDKC